jgi:ABC-type uncharacterized transport system permease subunit
MGAAITITKIWGRNPCYPYRNPGWQCFVPGVAIAASSAFSSVIIWSFDLSVAKLTPLLFVLLGEMLTQRTGIINLGVEGQMLVGAFAGFAATVTFHIPGRILVVDWWVFCSLLCNAWTLLGLSGEPDC